MANEPLSLKELKEWYASFNAVINAYSGGTIQPLTDPAEGSKVLPEHINNAYDKITAMQNDEYLKTQNFYGTFSSKVAAGEEVKRADATPIITTATQIVNIKCRNTSTFTNGYHTNTQKSHSTHSHGTNYWGNKSNGNDSNGTWGNENNANGCNSVSSCGTNWCNNSLCYWGTKGYGTWNNGADNNGALSHGEKSNGDNTHAAKSHSGQIDILNVHTTVNKN